MSYWYVTFTAQSTTGHGNGSSLLSFPGEWFPIKDAVGSILRQGATLTSAIIVDWKQLTKQQYDEAMPLFQELVPTDRSGKK